MEENCKYMFIKVFLVKGVRFILGILCIMFYLEYYRGCEE